MIPTTLPDWTAWEPDRDIDSCCAWAESLLFTAAIKNQWNQHLASVSPDWFGQWSYRVLWEGLKIVIPANDGVFEPNHIRDWLTEHEPDYATDLLDTLSQHGDRPLQFQPPLERAVSTLRRAGERRMVMRWAMELVEICRSAAPITVIRDIVRQAPTMNGGAA